MRNLIASDVMTRTTLDIDPSVLKELRQRAERDRKSLGTLASELLAQQLASDEAQEEPEPFRWISRDLGLPRVDLEDKDALWAILDAEE
jgi:hypothetical protein